MHLLHPHPRPVAEASPQTVYPMPREGMKMQTLVTLPDLQQQMLVRLIPAMFGMGLLMCFQHDHCRKRHSIGIQFEVNSLALDVEVKVVERLYDIRIIQIVQFEFDKLQNKVTLNAMKSVALHPSPLPSHSKRLELGLMEGAAALLYSLTLIFSGVSLVE